MNKKIFMILFISITLILCTTVSAEDLTTTDSGVVNGGVYTHAVQNTPYSQQISGGNLEEVSFNLKDNTQIVEDTQNLKTQSNEEYQDIQTDNTNANTKNNIRQDSSTITSIQAAKLYTMVYVQSTNDRYGSLINVTLDGDNDGTYETVLENNTELRISSSQDGTVYTVNENITRVYSDYLLTYDIAKFIKSDSIKVKVQTYSGPELYVADAKIKCVGLNAAYNVSSSDKEYYYWFNMGHSWTDESSQTSFVPEVSQEALNNMDYATLTQVATSSAKADTWFNGILMDVETPSNYFSENKWDVTDLIEADVNTLDNEPTGGLYGATYKTISVTLVVAANVPSSSAEVNLERFRVSSNGGDVLVYVDNKIQATLNNTGSTIENAQLTLNIDDYSQTVNVTDLSTKSKRYDFTYVTEDKGTKQVTLTIDYLNGITETLYTGELEAKYNGYMGKSFTEGNNFTTKREYEGFNTLNIIPVHEYKSASWQNFTSTIDAAEFGLTDSEKIVEVLYYQGYNWDYGFVLDTYQLQVNGAIINLLANYNDTKGFGAQWDFPSGVLVYNITDAFKANDTNIFNITRNTDDNLALYTGYIVAIYENSTRPSIIKINEETDLLNTEASGYGTNSTTAITYSIYDDIDTTYLNSASLCVVSGAANFPDSNVIVNDVRYGSMSDGFNQSQQQSFSTYEVNNLVNGSNLVTLQSIEDNLVVLGTILTLNYDEPLVNVDSVEVTSNTKNFLVGEDNTISVALSCENEHSGVEVTLKVDDDELTQDVGSVATRQTVEFTYVPTVNGTKNIEVLIKYLNDSQILSYEGNLTAYYNGYMGKSFTDGENFTTNRRYSGLNTLVISPFDFYKSNWVEFTQDYDAAANGIVDQDKVVDVLYYQGYNWNNRDLNIDVTINDVNSDILGNYSDSKGFANYNYPSGVLVYNLTTGFKANEVNSIKVTPLENNGNALYGGYLVIIYANNTKETEIMINEGADMLNPESSGFGANSSNTFAYSNYDDVVTADEATLYTITAAAEKNDGSMILVNGKGYTSLADNYNNISRISIVSVDVDNLVDGENIVVLQSYSDNLLAMGTILIVSKSVETAEPELVLEPINATVGQSINLTAKIMVSDEIMDISLGKVSFKVNGKTVKDANGKVIYAKVVKGVATIEDYVVPESWRNIENITIKAVYSGSSKLNSITSDVASITINDEELSLTTQDISASAGASVKLEATLSDNMINTGKIVFKINGKTVKDTNGKVIYAKVVNGTVSVDYVIPDSYKATDYNITAVYIPVKGDKITVQSKLTVTE